MSETLEVLHRKLALLCEQRATAADPELKLRLSATITRTKAQIAELETSQQPPSCQQIAPTRLPHAAHHPFGRDDELANLEAAWQDPRLNVITLVARGGAGKTALLARWAADLARRHYDGASYFDWSFYSQGTRDQTTASADAFIDAALRHFGADTMADSSRSPWDKGAHLANLLAQHRALLVLDGLEPLQHPPGPLAGELKDPAITALLKGLVRRNAGLCIVTTREPVKDLAAWEETTAHRWYLEQLSTDAGVELLTALGVQGSAADLTRLVNDVQGHALTLNLLGRYLHQAHGGNVRKRDLVTLQEADGEIEGGHCFRVIAAYERWFASAGEKGQRRLAVLRLLGLFDRPASPDCLRALRQEPAIPNLTEPLVGLDEGDWDEAISDLKACSLLTADQGTLDIHPLLREHLAHQLQQHHPGAWQAAHSRLFDHLSATTEHQPDTLAGLQPLYQAVAHGCQAGRYEEACANVYWHRISRRGEIYPIRKLGARGAELGAVACFFTSPWSRVAPAAGAGADLAEAEEIAQRSPMPLILADVALYRARLFRDVAALREARRLVDLHGYGRREDEVADLEAVAEDW